MPSAVSVRGISQSFRQGFWLKRKSVLRGVSVEIERGSVFGLIGPNGAGKTTLIHLIAGVRTPDSGTVLVEGEPATRRDARRHIGFLPERPYFHPFLTGAEFLGTMAELAGLHGSARADAVERALAQVGLEHAAGRRLSGYSKGMLQRIGIAQAILHDPSVLIMDEPMSGLDPHWRRKQRELISSLAGAGKTILFSSHSLEDVEHLCDDVGLIRDGGLSLRSQGGGLVAGMEVVVSGIGADEALACAPEGSAARPERGTVRVSLPPSAPSDPVIAALISRGAQVRAVHLSPLDWERPDA